MCKIHDAILFALNCFVGYCQEANMAVNNHITDIISLLTNHNLQERPILASPTVSIVFDMI